MCVNSCACVVWFTTVYYVNHMEKTTTWDRPGMAAATPVGAAGYAGAPAAAKAASLMHGACLLRMYA